MRPESDRTLSLDRQEAVRELLSMAARLLEDPAALDQPRIALSPGELQLLALLQSHMTGVEIAAHLGITMNTLKTRLRRLYRKLGVTSRPAATEAARRRGLVAGS